ncbi:hypothetical protein Tco_1001492, partial [Tanacetum coccineum]
FRILQPRYRLSDDDVIILKLMLTCNFGRVKNDDVALLVDDVSE